MAEAKKSILLVDDDETFRVLLAGILDREGYDVREAANGQMALEAIQDKSPTIIISDVRMPVVDGIELFERIRSLDINVPFIFMTGYLDILDDERALKMQAAGFISKPFSPDEILFVIEGVLSKSE